MANIQVQEKRKISTRETVELVSHKDDEPVAVRDDSGTPAVELTTDTCSSCSSSPGDSSDDGSSKTNNKRVRFSTLQAQTEPQKKATKRRTIKFRLPENRPRPVVDEDVSPDRMGNLLMSATKAGLLRDYTARPSTKDRLDDMHPLARAALQRLK